MCHFRAQNGPYILNEFLLIQIIITFIYLLALFIVQNLRKFLQQIQSYEDAPFLGQKWSICPKQIFFEKLLISFSSTYQPLSLCKISKKFFQRNFWAQNSLFSQMRIFAENLLMSLVSFIHAYLNAKNQSQILIY